VFGVSQKLHQGLSTDEVNEHLALGARIVYLKRAWKEGLWDAVFETEAVEADPRLLVLDFLANVDPGKLEDKMLENPSLDAGPGKTALAALAEMVTGASS
jgi:hypothetical protein